ncbi:hypothetical protein KCU85_g190, partial [Aureobasidium melanogenum]
MSLQCFAGAVASIFHSRIFAVSEVLKQWAELTDEEASVDDLLHHPMPKPPPSYLGSWEHERIGVVSSLSPYTTRHAIMDFRIILTKELTANLDHLHTLCTCHVLPTLRLEDTWAGSKLLGRLSDDKKNHTRCSFRLPVCLPSVPRLHICSSS